jgi:hypothetical protein
MTGAYLKVAHLVKIIHCCQLFIQPDGVACTFAKLRPTRSCQKRRGDAICALSSFSISIQLYARTTNQFKSGNDVAPLIRSSDLDGTADPFVQDKEVIRL